MAVNRSWEAYPASYRAKEMQTLANWILSGESGSVVGLVGCGRSNLLGFLCYRPEVLPTYLPSRARPFALIPVDLNDMPADDLSTLYRIILRSFDRVRDRFKPLLQQTVTDLYRETRGCQDPFLPQSALHELLLQFQDQDIQVVLVLNQFDRFCENATSHMLNTLRGLRDNFKDTLCYIVGMCQEVAYLPDMAALGDMYELLDSHVCWVGPMNDTDARFVISQNTYAATDPPNEAEMTAMLRLAGNFPSLLKAICYSWLTTTARPVLGEWEGALLAQRSLHYRLARMWDGLTQEEQFVLSEVQKLAVRAEDAETRGSKRLENDFQGLENKHGLTLGRLVDKGLCVPADVGWQVFGDLLDSYIAKAEHRGYGTIWPDEHKQIFQGDQPVEDLTDLEREVLLFFLKQPRERLEKTDIIVACWPDEVRRDKGVSDDALARVISNVRKQIEPIPSEPRYIVTWRSRHKEGGYIFYPEGRPG
jgi:DNA-binding winged helix-turn-helix (wHTH) protein